MSTLANAILLQAALPSLPSNTESNEPTRFAAVVSGALRGMGMISSRSMGSHGILATVQNIGALLVGTSQSRQQRHLRAVFAAR